MQQGVAGGRTVEIEVGLLGMDEVAATRALEGVFASPPYVKHSPLRGPAETAFVILAGTAAIDALIARIASLTFQEGRHGFVIDTRHDTITSDEHEGLKKGVFVVVHDKDTEVTHVLDSPDDHSSLLRFVLDLLARR